jgi:YfiH family protein
MNIKKANWPAPAHITALSTTRLDGFSQPPYAGNNLALHVGDEEKLVQKNRQGVQAALQIPHEPTWLWQTHSTRCIIAERESERSADAAITRSSKHPLVILTADCLPILLCNKEGTEIAAIHAGWKGLQSGIVENTLNRMQSTKGELLAWIGPAICANCYEVGEEVKEAFTSKHAKAGLLFKPSAKGKWLANLAGLAQMVLQNLGLGAVYQSNLCTYEANDTFYSYRRESTTGRIGTFIWFNNN